MTEQQATEEVEEITTEPAVVNVEHLMAYVDEQREEGNAAFKKKRHAEALAAWSKQPLGSAPARLLCLLRARLAALGVSSLSGRGRPTRRPATAF